MASKAAEEGNKSAILRLWLVMCFQLIKEVQESVPDFRDIVYGLSGLGAMVEARLRGKSDKEGKEEDKRRKKAFSVAWRWLIEEE